MGQHLNGFGPLMLNKIPINLIYVNASTKRHLKKMPPQKYTFKKCIYQNTLLKYLTLSFKNAHNIHSPLSPKHKRQQVRQMPNQHSFKDQFSFHNNNTYGRKCPRQVILVFWVSTPWPVDHGGGCKWSHHLV